MLNRCARYSVLWSGPSDRVVLSCSTCNEKPIHQEDRPLQCIHENKHALHNRITTSSLFWVREMDTTVSHVIYFVLVEPCRASTHAVIRINNGAPEIRSQNHKTSRSLVGRSVLLLLYSRWHRPHRRRHYYGRLPMYWSIVIVIVLSCCRLPVRPARANGKISEYNMHINSSALQANRFTVAITQAQTRARALNRVVQKKNCMLPQFACERQKER